MRVGYYEPKPTVVLRALAACGRPATTAEVAAHTPWPAYVVFDELRQLARAGRVRRELEWWWPVDSQSPMW